MVSGVMQGVGTFLQVWSAIEAGQLAEVASERDEARAAFMRWESERAASDVIGASHRMAAEERRQGGLAASRILAVAAASGGGVSDPTIVNLIARAKGEGAYRAGNALYEGESQARRLRIQGITGANVSAGSAGYNAQAAGYLAKGAASLYSRYGGRGPNTGPSGNAALLDAGTPDFAPVA